MGKLGFVFEVFSHEVFEKKDVYFEGKKFEKQFLVIFILSNKIKSDVVIGMYDFLHKESSQFVYLNSDLGFSPYFIFEDAIFKYGKICVYNTKVVDFRDFTFWFDVKRYKEVRDILTLNNINGNLEDELRRRVLKVLEYF